MRSVFVVIIWMTVMTVFAQQDQYPFIRYEKNKIQYGKDSSNMMNFFNKLDDLQNGKRNKLTVIHIGGSHIQAGIWSEAVHDKLQELGKFEGGGMFAFPFKLGKTNSPHSFKTFSDGEWKRCRCIMKEKCTPLGVSGIAVVTNDSANYFGLKIQENGHLKNFNSVKVYHNFNPSFHFSLRRSSPVAYKRIEHINEGYTLYEFEEAIDTICFDLVRKDTLTKDFALYGFSLENDKPGIYYASMGVNGASTESFLKCEDFVTQLRTLKPDLVVFSLGVNDSHGPNFTGDDFAMHYDTLANWVQAAAPGCAIMFTTITDNYIRRKIPNKKSIYGENALIELAQKRNYAVWDIFTIMGGYKSMYKWYLAHLASRDKVHFNSKGYHVVADLMFEAMMNSYKANTSLNK